MAGRTQGDEHGLLARVSRVLGAFTEDELELTATTIAARAGLARSTAHRLLTGLCGLGLLATTASGGYSIGNRLWELGELSPLSSRLREQSLPFLQQLYEAGGENVHLAVLDGSDPASAEALYVHRLTGPTSIPTLSRMGGRHPLHTTGVGKALLMTRDEGWISRFFEQKLIRKTVYSVIDERRLRADLVTARARGYATTRQEMSLGNVSIAAPIRAVPGLPQAAVGIVSHLAHVDEKRLAKIVIRAADGIARELRAS